MSDVRYFPAWRYELADKLLAIAVAAPAGSGSRRFLLKAVAEITPWEDCYHIEEFKGRDLMGNAPNVSYWQTYEALDPAPLREIYDAYKLRLVDVSPEGVSRLQQAILKAEESWRITRSASQLRTAQTQEPELPERAPDASEQS